jgi:HEAT repeat protein
LTSDGASGLSEGFATTAWDVASVVAVLLFLLLMQILLMRVLIAVRRRREQRFRALWEPLFAECVDAVPAQLPVLERRDAPAFLMIWNHLQESLRDEVTERLNQLARRVAADEAALSLLRHGGVRDRLIAITALGHLRDDREWDRLAELIGSEDGVVSLSAARALMRIDADRAARPVIGQLAERADWPTAIVAAMLAEAGAEAISGPLAEAVGSAGPERAPWLIRLLEFAHSEVAGPVVRSLLEDEEALEKVIACLRVAADPVLLDRIRELMHDPRWPVRLHAAQALSRLGTRDDEAPLVAALSDPQWWVRYRAAQALASLPLISVSHIEHLSRTLDDPFSRDILCQVLAEKELAC